MQLEQYTAKDYLYAFRRRSKIFYFAFSAIFVAAASFAVFLPDAYRSAAEMSINLEGPNIDLLEPVALTAYADQYVKSLQQRVLTNQNLIAWLEESNAYAEERGDSEISEFVNQMREDIRVDMVFTSVIDEAKGNEVDLITGFTVAFSSQDPQVAHTIAKNVSTAFLAEDRATRMRSAATASDFLREQIDQKQAEIVELESKIAKFKEENAGNLPDLMFLNMTVLERTERDLQELQTEINNLQQNQLFRKAQLDELRLNSGAGARLIELEDEYLRAVSIYGANHPDVIRLSRQIAALTSADLGTDGGDSEIDRLEAELAEARERYTAAHPDIATLERKIAALRAQGQAGTSAGTSTDPKYLELIAQVNALDSSLAGLRAREAELREKVIQTEARIARGPQVERQYQALERDLQTAQLAFDDLRKRLAQAQQTQSFESGERGARLELVRSASFPNGPTGPPRVVIAILGAIIGLTLAGGATVIAEITDSTIRGRKDIMSVMGTHPIAAIPVVENSLSQGAQRRQLMFLMLNGLLLAAIVSVVYMVIGG